MGDFLWLPDVVERTTFDRLPVLPGCWLPPVTYCIYMNGFARKRHPFPIAGDEDASED